MDNSKGRPQKTEISVTKQIAKKTLVAYGVIVGSTAFLYLSYLLSSVIFQLVVALIVALALQPTVRLLMRRGLGRTAAVIMTMCIAFLGAILVTSLIVTPFITQGTRLIENAPQLVSDLVHHSQFAFLNEQYHIVDRVKELSQSQITQIAGAGLPFLSVLRNIIGGISSATIIFVFALFILLQGPELWVRALRFLSAEQAVRANKVADKMSKAVGGFVTGNVLISLIAGTVALVTLLILRVPYAFALAALVAIFDLVPMVGAALGTIIVALVALTQGVVVTVIAVAVLLVYQVIEGHFIQPLVYSRVISLSPLFIILASVIGAELGGIVGVLLAIPAAAVVQIAVGELMEA